MDKTCTECIHLKAKPAANQVWCSKDHLWQQYYRFSDRLQYRAWAQRARTCEEYEGET